MDTNTEVKMSEKLEKTTEKSKKKYLKHDLPVSIIQKTILGNILYRLIIGETFPRHPGQELSTLIIYWNRVFKQ